MFLSFAHGIFRRAELILVGRSYLFVSGVLKHEFTAVGAAADREAGNLHPHDAAIVCADSGKASSPG